MTFQKYIFILADILRNRAAANDDGEKTAKNRDQKKKMIVKWNETKHIMCIKNNFQAVGNVSIHTNTHTVY